MNNLKTVVVTVILMAVGYAVYVSIWQKPEKSTADKTSDKSGLPLVSIPGQGASNAQSPSGSVGSSPSTPVSPGTLGSPPSLFGSNSRGNSSGSTSPRSNSTGSTGSVTLIPGPNTANAPVDPSIPAPGTTASYSQPTDSISPTSPTSAGGTLGQDEFRQQYLSFIQEIQKKLDDGKLPEALGDLTSVYELPNLPELQRREVEHLLDQLAGTVIYSPQSYLERPYLVQQGDTLDQIADRCSIPALLLARINGIDPQQPLQQNQELKVLRGPFTAVISLDKHELTLKLQGSYYAGRFPIGVGNDIKKLEGSYTVTEKTPRPIYRGPDGINFPAEDARNPLGKFLISLGDRTAAIHGTANETSIGLHGTTDETGIGRDGNRGIISLKNRDIDDLFGILSVGSQVVIRR